MENIHYLRNIMKDDIAPLISFVIPAYNKGKYILNAVHSITDQIIQNGYAIEVVIVDDGSTDETPKIVDELAKADNRVRVIHQENQWIYASFNNGIKASNGEYIYILNADDLLFAGSIQMLIDKVTEYHHPDIIWTKVIQNNVDYNQNVLNVKDLNNMVTREEYYDNVEDIKKRWIFLQESHLAHNQANLYKKELLLRYPFRNDVYGSDTIENISLAYDVKTMLISPEPVYKYMAYISSDENASIGKYYGYEHEMFNEITQLSLELYRKWCVSEDIYLEKVVMERLHVLTYEIQTLAFSNCKLSEKEKIEIVFKRSADTYIRDLSRRIGREREYESRILNGVKDLIASFNCDYELIPNYVLTLIRFLPDDYKDNLVFDDLDYKIIQEAIDDTNNPDQIGKVYYYSNW